MSQAIPPATAIKRLAVDLIIIFALTVWNTWGWLTAGPGFWASFARSGAVVIAYFFGRHFGALRSKADTLAARTRPGV